MRSADSPASADRIPVRELFADILSWQGLMTLFGVVILAMSTTYMIGGLFLLNGLVRSSVPGVVLGIFGIVFIVVHYRNLFRYVRESRELRKAGQARRPYPVLGSLLGLAAIYFVVASCVATAIEASAAPTPSERERLAHKILASPPW